MTNAYLEVLRRPRRLGVGYGVPLRLLAEIERGHFRAPLLHLKSEKSIGRAYIQNRFSPDIHVSEIGIHRFPVVPLAATFSDPGNIDGLIESAFVLAGHLNFRGSRFFPSRG